MHPAPAASQPTVPGVILRDAASGRWIQFTRLRELVRAGTVGEVAAALARVEEAVLRDGLYAAGFVAYEAAPAFDDALVTHDGGAFPLLWFGLYEGVEEVELPALESGAEFVEMDWQGSVGQREFHERLAQIKSLIRSGDTYQVNYTYRLQAPFAGDPWNLFRRLVAAQDPPYGAYVDTGEWVVCSASPELFFRLDGTRIECRPMKGTAARGRTPAEDRAQARALQASEKERAENVMIVDMVRHDLGRVAQPGSVQTTRLFKAERYPTVWQMTSTIEARTEAGLGEIFRALFPAASITGAPKVRTMQIIAGLEPLPRRLYTGTIGFLVPGRRAQFNVAIRTVLANRRTGCAEYGVGGGITWDSTPGAEWEECRTKTGILSSAAPEFCLLETLRWTPEEGYFLLERHLERLRDSADYFGFGIDLEAIRSELERPVRGFGGRRQRVRLLVAKDGRMSVQAQALAESAAKPLRVAFARAPVDDTDRFLYHKTTNRGVYEAARAACPGFDDVLLFNGKGEITESTIANVAVEIQGRLCTPPVSCGLLAGTLRAQLLQQGELVERPITVEEALRSRDVILLNSVRGKYRVELDGAGSA